jgi:hypothetical protein
MLNNTVGLDLGLELLEICDELWAFGDKVSEGMAGEIARAGELGLRVKRFNSQLELEAAAL